MDSQADIHKAIAGHSASEALVLRGKHLDTESDLARETRTDSALDSILSYIPGVNLAFRFAKSWHHEFEPKVYGDQPVLLRTPQSDKAPGQQEQISR